MANLKPHRWSRVFLNVSFGALKRNILEPIAERRIVSFCFLAYHSWFHEKACNSAIRSALPRVTWIGKPQRTCVGGGTVLRDCDGKAEELAICGTKHLITEKHDRGRETELERDCHLWEIHLNWRAVYLHLLSLVAILTDPSKFTMNCILAYVCVIACRLDWCNVMT
jgi:hypothetical protein